MAKSLPEDSIIKRFRKSKPKMWMYHSIPKKQMDNVKRKGLDLKYHGTTHSSPVEHPSGKPAFSYSTNKSYAAVWGDKDSVLLVNVPTKDLFFGIRTTMFGWKEDIDEYQDINNIKPQDIIFPDDPKYTKVEKIIPYLKKGKFY